MSLKFQHTVQVPEKLELAWSAYRTKHPGVSFNGFVLGLIAAALKVKAKD